MSTSFLTTEYTEAVKPYLKNTERFSGWIGIDRVERVEFFSRVEHKEHKDFEV